jgi:primosomal protein N' (replication factor Y)
MTKSSHNNCLVDVAVPLPVFNTFTYRSPQQYSAGLRVGMRVLVPFGKRRLTGYVVGFPDNEPQQDIKEIYDVLDEEPLFGEDDLKFYQWAAGYYYHPIGQTIKTALPKGLNPEYRYVVSITEKGKDLLKKPPGEFQGLSVLRELKEGAEVLLKHLEKRVGTQGFNYHIRLLKEKELIQLSLKKRGAAVRIRKEKWFSPVGTDIEKPVAGKQKEIFTFIAEKGDVSLTHLKQHFGNCASSLKSLKKKGAIAVEEREVFRKPPLHEEVFTEPVHELTPDQADILKQMDQAVKERKFYPFLLYGVTGSGKTEIYLKVMEQVLKSGRQCLYMVPEISLTLQLWDRISSRLKAPMAMLHSSLTSAERFDAWRMIKRGDVKIVIGARSAIFASFPDLGAIIVDEEHDHSYKQDEKLRYNARDLSLLKGKFSGCIVVLGSATPSLESFHNALKKKYFTGTLTSRIENRSLPHVKIIDMKVQTGLQRKKTGIISRQLQKAIQQRLSDGQQSLLFLNRRGFSPAFICQQCGYTFRCPNCEVSLIHHRGQKKLCCHYCDFSMPVPEECPKCGSYFLTSLGWGTERLEKEIKKLFPDARIARMDRDTTASRGASRAIIKGLYCGDIDILTGTQMIAKSYHLPNITLVGVICADQSLNFPDYRASERTFQLLTQVAGRAGRGDFHGEVLIQAYNPDHYSITCAQGHDYRKFYEIEMGYRKELGYPPYKRIINIRFEGPSRTRVEACSREIGNLGRQLLESSGSRQAVEILGPARAPWEKIKGRYRYQMLIKGSSIQRLRSFTSKVLEQGMAHVKEGGINLIVDVDPLFLM